MLRHWLLKVPPLLTFFDLPDLPRRLHRRPEFIRRLQTIPARLADQQVLFQTLDFRPWKGPHGVSFQRVIGGVLHGNHGRGIEGAGSDSGGNPKHPPARTDRSQCVRQRPIDLAPKSRKGAHKPPTVIERVVVEFSA